MREFINNEALTQAIQQRQFLPRPHTSFATFSSLNGILRVLLAGPCPLCAARHMRNICNQKYVDECIGPIMRLVFPVIQTVLAVLSDDSDLEALVRQKNGRVTTPFGIHDKMTFHQLNKFCLDLHPEIDGYVKSLADGR